MSKQVSKKDILDAMHEAGVSTGCPDAKAVLDHLFPAEWETIEPKNLEIVQMGGGLVIKEKGDCSFICYVTHRDKDYLVNGGKWTSIDIGAEHKITRFKRKS